MSSSKQSSRITKFRPRLIKIVRDLSANKSRTLLVVLSIAVGIFAIAATLGARQVLMREFERGFEMSQRHSISYTLDDRSKRIAAIVDQIQQRDDVIAAEGRRIFSASFTPVPEGMSDAQALMQLPFPGEQKHTMHLQALEEANFLHPQVNTFKPLNTRSWPPGTQDIIIEASALQVFDFDIGDRLLLEAPTGRAVFRVAGFTHDINAIPTMFFEHVEAFISMDALYRLSVPPEMNRIMVNVDPELSRVQVARIADSIQDQQLEPAQITVNRMEVPEPGYHFFGSLFEAVSVLLLVMSFMALALSAFLVITTTNAILVQQTRQLGIMKAIGGRRKQIAELYFGLVLGYGALALLLGIPTGILFGRGFIDYASGVLNFYIDDVTYPPWVLLLLCVVGLLLPLCAAFFPILKGVKRPIVDALNSYSNRVGFGGGWIDRVLSKITFLSRPTALALRSTFSRKGRLMLTLTTLILASAVVMSVFSAQDSLDLTVRTIGSWWKFDSQIIFAHPVQSEELKRTALAHEDVIYAETWLDARTTIVRPDGTKNDAFWTVGIPYDTRVVDFEFEHGRAPYPGEQGVIINTEVFTTEDHLLPPTTVSLIVGGQEIERPVTGVATGSLHGAMIFMDRDDLAELLDIPGASTRVVVQAEGGQFAQYEPGVIYARKPLQQRIIDNLDERFTNKGFVVASTQTAAGQLQSSSEHLGILTTFLLIMAGALAIVGVIGLSGSMTLTVIESTREIGIMRSVGASHSAIFGIYITQGLVVGTLSWFFGAILSWPLSYGLMLALRHALDMRLSYTFSFSGIFIWLVMVWIISGLASLLPAWRASQVSIRDAISHE